ncbi:NepR family anti-sigma factor [Qipengyuania nanhaisediminis]|uniref:NepR family anti-sigma factor n=1 Tax=Qipengyuania nanhaisediminis TaxID=604088 RepID=UPI0038B38BF4
MGSKKTPDQAQPSAAEESPAWADGLKQLYDSVVDEPLPDTFKDLLAQLDDGDKAEGTSKGGEAKA